jgi:hypothetical protein
MHALHFSKEQMRALASVVPAALVELLRTTPLSHGKVVFAWRAIVGPAIERATAVRLEGRVLIVDTAGAQWTREIERSTATILPRLGSLLGRDTVARLEVRTNNQLNAPVGHRPAAVVREPLPPTEPPRPKDEN